MSYRIVLVLGVAILASALLVGSALAEKGGNGRAQTGESSIVLNELATTESATAVASGPRLGSSVSFTTVAAGLAGWEYPMVAVWCYQGDVLVYMELAFADSWFKLGGDSSDWVTNGGAADCEAYVYAYGWKGGEESIRTLAGTSFHAAAP